MLHNMLYLLRSFGPYTAVFLVLSFLLGLWYAWSRWSAYAGRIENSRDEFTRLADRVNGLRRRKSLLLGEAYKPMARAFTFPGETAPKSKKAVDPEELETERLSGVIDRDFGGESVKPDPRLGVLYTSEPAFKDDLKIVKGIGPAIEQKLNTRGVHRFKQLAAWNDDNVQAFSGELGTFPDRVRRDNWIGQARELVSLSAQEEAPSYKAPLVVDHAAAIAGNFSNEGVHVDEKFGIIYNDPPEVIDDFEQLEGIDADMEQKLYDAGIYRFKQLSSWSDDNVEAVSGLLDVPKDKIEAAKWVPQSRRLSLQTYRASSIWGSDKPSLEDLEGLAKREFAGENVQADEQFGILYTQPPAERDDLREITGIGKVLEKRLNGLGIYRFKQVANWSKSQVVAVSERVQIHPEYVFRDEWIPEAEQLVKEQAEILAAMPKPVAAPVLDAGVAALNDTTTVVPSDNTTMLVDDEPAVVAPEQSLFSSNIPETVKTDSSSFLADAKDSVSDAASGVSDVASAAVSSISGAVGHVVEAGRSIVKSPLSAAAEHFSGEDIDVDARLGVLYKTAPASRDDLTKIKGVGQVISDKLNQNGVYTFKQIAYWSPEQVDAFATELGTFQDRIDRDEWIAQAKALLDG